MDEFQGEEPDFEDVQGEEDELVGDEEEEIDLTEQQRAEAADLSKLFRQHPEIWIPYAEQVQQQLYTRPPSSELLDPSLHSMNLRETANTDQNHCTYPFLTNYERTKCISFRASQVANGAKPYVFIPPGVTDSYEIAKMELEQRRLPYILKRPLSDGSSEYWKLADLLFV
jgi:DNA-directed RNA polymerase I, II, and III subunit RPABC2